MTDSPWHSLLSQRIVVFTLAISTTAYPCRPCPTHASCAPEFSWDRLHGSTQFVVPPAIFTSAPRVAVCCGKHATSNALPPVVLLSRDVIRRVKSCKTEIKE